MFVSPQLASLLELERPALDQVFGAGAYQVESSHPHEAVVRTEGVEWRLGYDQRDGSIESLITASGVSWHEEAGSWLWMQFLGQETPTRPRTPTGHIAVSHEAQLKNELEWLAQLCSEVFSDPSKARDAASFVRGYNKAYNDWASGNWNPAD